jgi:methylmalonyl-CoA mutase
VVGASSLTAGHKTLVPGLVDELKKQGDDDILVVAGGIIPPTDYDYLYDRGVKAVFGPGTSVIVSANKTLDLIEAKLAA